MARSGRPAHAKAAVCYGTRVVAPNNPNNAIAPHSVSTSHAARRESAVRSRETAEGAPRSPLTDYDVYLFRQGKHHTLYEKLGAHHLPGAAATRFAVWAPNAARVAVIGDFNGWQAGAHALEPR